ncbi:MAG: catechol 2,3-dioxygenase-like lactoylglutathione lyase family enzyme [Bermanella sp.]|jgi:catechol 2,3-dioxygenase-like lactoylglutathione lyase family enzyme
MSQRLNNPGSNEWGYKTVEEGYVKNISHAVIHASDIKASIRFYQLLGFKVDRIISTDFTKPGDINDIESIPLNSSGSGEYYCVGMGLGREDPRTITRLEIMEWVTSPRQANYLKPAEHLGLVRIAFSVSGVAAIVSRLTANGHKVDATETIDISPKLSSVFAHVYDPDGNWLTLMEWIKK